jgi:hypothetical protein
MKTMMICLFANFETRSAISARNIIFQSLKKIIYFDLDPDLKGFSAGGISDFIFLSERPLCQLKNEIANSKRTSSVTEV